MVRTLWNEDDRRAIVTRLGSLTPESRGLWGSFDARQMVCHVTDTVRMATGELACASKKKSFLRYPVVKTLIMFYLPWPKGSPTAPELLARAPGEWDAELERFGSVLDGLARYPVDRQWPSHIVFGTLSKEQWGRFLYRHTDHHLRQFGV